MFRRRAQPNDDKQPLFETSLGPVWAEHVNGAQALDAWLARRRQGEGWPVILGEDDAVAEIVELAAPEEQPVERILEEAVRTNVDSLLQQWRQDADDDHDFEDWDVVGTWPEDHTPVHRLQVPYDFATGKPLDRLTLATLPVAEGWQAAAVLGWGGWNACPMPAEHVAIHRSWADRYGAEVVCMTRDVVEMQVARPPTTRDAAMALADEQYAYCNDIVDQGTESISALAAELIDAPFWFFWWD